MPFMETWLPGPSPQLITSVIWFQISVSPLASHFPSGASVLISVLRALLCVSSLKGELHSGSLVLEGVCVCVCVRTRLCWGKGLVLPLGTANSI